MENVTFALNSSWQVLAIGLLLGAGLPTLFAAGMRSLSWGTAHTVTGDHQPHPLGRVLAWICFGLVVLFIALGILVIVLPGFGQQLVFENGLPSIQPKGGH